MVKRIICFICVFVILIFNCVPVYAFSSVDIINISNIFETDLTLIDSYSNYYIYYLTKNSIPFFLLSSDEIVISIKDNNVILTNNKSSSILIYTGYPYNSSATISNGITTLDFGWGSNPVFNSLIAGDGKCLDEKFCEINDYNEGGVEIKGLVGFFNNTINYLKGMKESITNLPKDFGDKIHDLFVPDTDSMKTDFSDFTNYLSDKFGINELTTTLNTIVSSESDVAAANVSDNFSFNYSRTNNPGSSTIGFTDKFLFNYVAPTNSNSSAKVQEISFSLPFSQFFTESIKNGFSDILKGFFFILLLFYNLSEIYFLIRGTRPWKDPQIVMTMNQVQEMRANNYMSKHSK